MTTPRLFLGLFALTLLLPLLLLACGSSDEPTDSTSQGGVATSLPGAAPTGQIPTTLNQLTRCNFMPWLAQP